MDTKYIVVGWPEIQHLMEHEDFHANSYLVNDEQGFEDFGSSAYFVNEDWYKKVTGEPKEKTPAQIGMEAMNKFVFFALNFPSDFITKIWGENKPMSMAEHFTQKFRHLYELYGSRAALIAFYAELSDGNREKLLEFILNNFDQEQKLHF